MSKLNETRQAGQRTLIGIAIVGVSVYLGFTPLFDLVQGGVTGAVIGSSFGAIFVIILTMYLLNKQTEIEQESKKSEKVFEEKVLLYKSILATSKDMLIDTKISSQETAELSFSMVELQMVGADETINSFSSVFDKVNKIFNGKKGDPVELEDQERIDILQFIAWILPLIIFYYFINKLIIRSYQWFCFLLLIYFLFSSLRVFGTIPYWLDIVELLCICVLFIHIMFGPKSIRNMN